MKTANALAALELGSLRSSALWGDAVMHLELRSKVLKRVKYSTQRGADLSPNLWSTSIGTSNTASRTPMT